MGALESVLNTVLSGVAGLNEDFNRRQQHNDGEAAVTKALTTQAEKASQEGDWQWLHDNQQALQSRVHPDLLQSILSTATLNNARRYDAEVAEGGRPTIPLSPKNIYMRGAQQNYSIDNRPPEQAVLQANSGPVPSTNEGGAGPSFSGLQGVPNNEASLRGQQYGSLYTQPGQLQPPTAPAPMPEGADTPEDPALEGSLSLRDSIEQMKRVNAGLESVRNEYPAPTAQTPTVPTPTVAPTTDQPQEITLPSPRRPSSISLDFGGTKITKSAIQHTSEGITSSAVSQALAQGKSVEDAIQAVNNYNVEAAKKGLPGVAVDHAVISQAQTKQFHQLMMAEQQRLLQNGSMEPALAHQAAARYASQQLGGFVPTNFDGVVGYTPEERHTARVNQAMSFANMQLDGAMKAITASKQPGDITPNVLYDIVNQTPGLSLQDKHAVLVDSAQRLAQQLAPKLQASGAVTGPLAMVKAIQLAGSMTGGQVPDAWHKLVAGNPTEFGLSPQATELYLTGRYNIFKPGGMATLNAAAMDRTIQLDQLKSMSPEAAAASLDAMQQKQSTSQVLRAGGKTQRDLEVAQDAAKTTATVGARETEERRQSVKESMPMLKELTDAMHAVQDASKLKSFIPGTDANNALTLYEDKLESFKNAVAKGILGQSGNLTKNEQDDAKAALVGLWEARFKPAVAKQKVETLNRLLSKHYGQRIDLNALDPFNPDAPQPRVYGKDGKPAKSTESKSTEPSTPAKPPAGVRLYDNKGARVQ